MGRRWIIEVALVTLVLGWCSPLLGEQEKPRRYRPAQGSADGGRGQEAEAQHVRDIYRALAAQHGARVVFDQRLKDQRLRIDIKGLPLPEALDVMKKSAGHLIQLQDDGVWLIADDTPQNRRLYDEQVIRAFRLEHLDLKDAITMLRSLLSLKHVSAQEERSLVVIRDTADKVAIAADLLRRFDFARAEVETGVELWFLPGAAGQRLDRRGRRGDRDAGPTASVSRETLRRQGRRLAAPSLRSFEGEHASFEWQDAFRLDSGAAGVSDLELKLTLKVTPKVHGTSGEVTLQTVVEVTDLTRGDPHPGRRGPAMGTRRLVNQTRLAPGADYWLRGLLTTDDVGTALRPAESADLRGGELVLLLAPRVVRRSSLSEQDLEAICVGTETHLRLCR